MNYELRMTNYEMKNESRIEAAIPSGRVFQFVIRNSSFVILVGGVA
jgi:hypothetical protein